MAYTFKHGDRPLGGYTIQRAVGSGGFGEVYYAISDGGREVGLKYLRDHPEVELRGVSHCMNLKSPHLVSIFDVRKNNEGDYFILMEYCSGPSLRDLLIAEPDGLGEQKAAFFAREVGKGLSYLHDRGIVHRDLKPGNIFYDDGYVKIGDYGLSKFISVSRHSGQTASVGTVHYMAPEIGSGDYSRGVDIYALGVMLYEMLLGKVPFEGSSMGEVLMKHLTSQPEVDNLPEPFARVIRRALQKDPKDRYATVDEMISELTEVQAVQESLAGFSPQSLGGAVLRGGGDAAASPYPSPNPAPSPAFGGFADEAQAQAQGGIPQPPPPAPPRAFPVGFGSPLPPHLQKRVDKITRKVDRKLAKLRRRDGNRLGQPRAPMPVAPPIEPPFGAPTPNSNPVHTAPPRLSGAETRKRFLIAAVVGAGLAIGLGAFAAFVTNVPRVDPELIWLGTTMTLILVTPALVISRRILGSLGATAEPGWVRAAVTLMAVSPALWAGIVPILDDNADSGRALGFALMLFVLLTHWGKYFAAGRDGSLRVGSVIWSGIWAAILSAAIGSMMDARPLATWLGAFIGGGLALLAHLSGWWMPRARRWAAVDEHTGLPFFTYAEDVEDADDDQRAGRYAPQTAYRQPANQDGGSATAGGSAADDTVYLGRSPQAGETDSSMPMAGAFSDQPEDDSDPEFEQRSAYERLFWTLGTLAGFATMVIGFVNALTMRYDDQVECSILVCIIGFAVLFFCLPGTRWRRRPGIWRNAIRPLLMSVSFVGMGLPIIVLSGHPTYGADHNIAVVMLALASLLLLVTFASFLAGRRKKFKPASFLMRD